MRFLKLNVLHWLGISQISEVNSTKMQSSHHSHTLLLSHARKFAKSIPDDAHVLIVNLDTENSVVMNEIGKKCSGARFSFWNRFGSDHEGVIAGIKQQEEQFGYFTAPTESTDAAVNGGIDQKKKKSKDKTPKPENGNDNLSASASAWPSTDSDFDGCILRWSSNRSSNEFSVAAIATVLKSGAPLWIYGTRDEGTFSAVQLLTTSGLFSDASLVDSKHFRDHESTNKRSLRHDDDIGDSEKRGTVECGVVACSRNGHKHPVFPKADPGAIEFTDSNDAGPWVPSKYRKLKYWQSDATIDINGVQHQWSVYPGLFSGGLVDVMTVRLIEAFPASLPTDAKVRDSQKIIYFYHWWSESSIVLFLYLFLFLFILDFYFARFWTLHADQALLPLHWLISILMH
jgi:hypothetical protein